MKLKPKLARTSNTWLFVKSKAFSLASRHFAFKRDVELLDALFNKILVV